MKRLSFILGFVLLLLLSFGCCAKANSINSPQLDLVNHLQNSTVSLVFPTEDGSYMPYCAGVWINKTDFITARHCVEDSNEDVELGSLYLFQIYKEFEYNYPFSENDKAYVARVVVASEIAKDLAILRTLDNVPHSTVTIATYNPKLASPIHHVGHPKALGWSYMPATISQIRKAHNRVVLHVLGGIWMGSSGGGAFDNQGSLIGICSVLLSDGRGSELPIHSMFIHIKEIKYFLNKNDIKYNTLN